MDWPTVFGGGLYKGYFSRLQTIGMLILDDLFALRFRFKALSLSLYKFFQLAFNFFRQKKQGRQPVHLEL